jgi:hypothetical protein
MSRDRVPWDPGLNDDAPLSHGVSRRQLLVGAAAAVAAVPPLYAFPFLTAHASGSKVVTKAQFVPLVGTDFHIGAGGRTVACRLESVTDLPIPPNSPPPAPGGEAFSLLFARSQRLGFGQGTYLVSHVKLGSFPLLVVPVGPASAAQRCEAVVNRLWS